MKTVLLILALAITSIGFANTPESVTRILNSGDGESAKTAYEVYSTTEEYQLLMHLNKKPNTQMLSVVDDEYYDVFKINDKLVWFKRIKKTKRIVS